MCCDLTRPVTGGTVNIWLSCDSLHGLKEPTKGQCFLMPLPTTKLSDFISRSCICPILGDGYIGGVASLCSYTAMIIHISTHNKHACIRTHVGFVPQAHPPSPNVYVHIPTDTPSGTWRALTTSGFVFVHVMSDSDSSVLTRLIKQIAIHVHSPNAVQKVK